MTGIKIILLLFAAWVMGAVALAIAPAKESAAQTGVALPFARGETYYYKIYWNGLKVGEAILKFYPEVVAIHGEPALHFSFNVWTTGWINAFYQVKNIIHSYAACDLGRALYFTKNQKEGGSVRDIVLTFDWKNKTAQYTNFGQPSAPISIVDGTHDPLSVMFAARLQPMVVGAVLTMPVTDGKKFQQTGITVVRKEKIKVEAGEFDTVVVQPEMRMLGGVFNKEKDAAMFIWFSDDARRIPLKMKSKVTFGSFVGELASEENAATPKMSAN